MFITTLFVVIRKYSLFFSTIPHLLTFYHLRLEFELFQSQYYIYLSRFQRTEAIEEGLSCFLVQRPETDRISALRTDLSGILSGLSQQQQEAGLKQYLNVASLMTNSSRLQLLLKVLHDLVQRNVLQAQYVFCPLLWFLWSMCVCSLLYEIVFFRMVCECILMSEKLTYKNGVFWIECFNLIRKIIGDVFYKKIRDCMKVSASFFFLAFLIVSLK